MGMNLANKYRPKDFDSVVEQSLVVTMLRNICTSDELVNRNFLLIGPAGTGKAQPLYSKVLTSNRGFISMKDVTVGTLVYTSRGNIGKVSGVYPQGVRRIYEILLRDSSTIRVSDEHLNVVYRYNSDNNIREEFYVTTIDLIQMISESSYPIRIDVADLPWDELLSSDTSDFSLYSSQIDRNRYSEESGRDIVSITYIDDEPCQCIMVDHPDHTYISDDFIPTHNTTTARIMADVLNNGEGEPIEIDAASHNGVESVREIAQQARAYPIGSKYKVFIYDESHTFSQQAWQAFLKLLEDGAGRSVHIFCTTNPEKIPPTILSRVQTFQLSKISLEGITSRLKHVLDCEIAEGRKISYDDDAIQFIAKLAYGGMRDALTLTDKALTYNSDLTLSNLESALNLPSYDDYFSLLQMYARHDNSGIASIIDRVYNSGVNFVKWFEDFHSFVMNIVKYILLQDISKTMIPSNYLSKVSKYTTAHLLVCLNLSRKLMDINSDLKSTQYLQEVALTHLCYVSKK